MTFFFLILNTYFVWLHRMVEKMVNKVQTQLLLTQESAYTVGGEKKNDNKEAREIKIQSQRLLTS